MQHVSDGEEVCGVELMPIGSYRPPWCKFGHGYCAHVACIGPLLPHEMEIDEMSVTCLKNGGQCTHVTCTAYHMNDATMLKGWSVCATCGHGEEVHEMGEYRGDKPRSCMAMAQGTDTLDNIKCKCKKFVKQEQRVNLHLNVYKATFEYVKREAGSDTYRLADVDPEETLIAAPDFGAACSLAEEVAKETLKNRRFTHLTEIRVRDIVLLHAGVRLYSEKRIDATDHKGIGTLPRSGD